MTQPRQILVENTLRQRYEARLADGEIDPDPAQEDAIAVLEDFANQLRENQSPRGFINQLFSKNIDRPSGLYLYGDVGRGKSMLMDLFYATSDISKKRRVHFHQFMLEIHDRLHHLQNQRVDDVLPHMVADISNETRLLCFDEFHVSNIADAMILGRLFSTLFAAGVTIITTSNWPPDALYKNGLQRDRFLPFIELIKQKMIIHCLAGMRDHRYEQVRDLQTYFTPLGIESTRKLQGLFLQLTHEAKPEPLLLPVQGRTLKVTHAAKGVGFFNFDELCRTALSAADYLAIAACLHTIILDGVPRLQVEQHDETIRFMNLIDALYEAKVNLFMAAAAIPEKLVPSGESRFAFQRTISRLIEMQGESYRKQAHLR
jgi:cell division protein ZapE